MPAASFTPTPHTEAMALLRGKAPVSRRVFDAMLPELRARAFTITGIESARILGRARDLIAQLPEGRTWTEVREDLVGELSPFLSTEPTGEDGDGPSPAEQRADLLIRTHGFQAFNATTSRVIQEDEDSTHIQYLATEDGAVREEHIALNGLILPKDDPFWATHTPPWDWGCRCRIRAINPDLLDEARADDAERAPEDRLVMEGPMLQRLRDGQLQRRGQTYDVSAPSERRTDAAYQWHPDNLRVPLDQLRERYAPEDFAAFEAMARREKVEMNGREMTVWEWLQGKS